MDFILNDKVGPPEHFKFMLYTFKSVPDFLSFLTSQPDAASNLGEVSTDSSKKFSFFLVNFKIMKITKEGQLTLRLITSENIE